MEATWLLGWRRAEEWLPFSGGGFLFCHKEQFVASMYYVTGKLIKIICIILFSKASFKGN